jgi:hypothetical protein
MKRFIVFLFFVALNWPEANLNAQFQLEGQFDLGDNNLSKGLYLQFSNFGYYDRPYWGAQTGYQLGLVQPQKVFFNSWYLSSFGKLPLGKIRLDLGTAYLWTSFAPDLREINWIIYTKTTVPHCRLAIGINRRIYRLSNKAANNDQNAGTENQLIREWNIMYIVGYILKPVENKWNFMFVVTDYDRFLIQQETNPMINIRFDYKLSEPVSLYSELWYKSAGLLNIKVNYFGTFIRIGALWDLSGK